MINTMPHELEVENYILGRCLIEGNNTYFNYCSQLKEELFYNSENKEILKKINEVANSGENVDMITVSTKGIEPHKLIQKCETIISEMSNGLQYFVNVLKAQYAKRELLLMSYEIQSKLQDKRLSPLKLIADTQSKLEKIYNQNSIPTEKKLATLVDENIQLISEIQDGKVNITRIPFGIDKIDFRTGGGSLLGETTFIAGETSQGKTTLALNMLRLAAKKYPKIIRALIVSIEMTSTALVFRFLAMDTGINNQKFTQTNEKGFGVLGVNDWQQIEQKVDELKALNIWIADKLTEENEIFAKIKQMKLKYDINLVVIDYLQIMGTSTKYFNEEAKLASISRRFQHFGKKENICFWLISQFSRDKNNPTPRLSRLRGSGQIEEAADNVIAIWRPDFYKIDFDDTFINDESYDLSDTQGKAQIIQLKGRNLGVGQAIVGFNPELTLISENENEYQSNEMVEGIENGSELLNSIEPDF